MRRVEVSMLWVRWVWLIGCTESMQRARRWLALSGAVLILLFAGVQCFLLISGMANPSLS